MTATTSDGREHPDVHVAVLGEDVQALGEDLGGRVQKGWTTGVVMTNTRLIPLVAEKSASAGHRFHHPQLPAVSVAAP